MAGQLNKECSQHGYNCPDFVVQMRADGDLVLVAINATYTMTFCPWCGMQVQQEEHFSGGSNAGSESTADQGAAGPV